MALLWGVNKGDKAITLQLTQGLNYHLLLGQVFGIRWIRICILTLPLPS